MKSKDDCDCNAACCPPQSSLMQTILPLVVVVLVGVLAFGMVGMGLKGPDGTVAVKQIERMDHSVAVSGQATKTVAPDQFEMGLAMTTNAPTAKEAVAQNAQKIANVKQALLSWGLLEKEMRTSGYNVYEDTKDDWVCDNELPGALDIPQPKCQWVTTKNGFIATESLAVKTSRVADAGDLLDVATSSGASSISYTQFSISNAMLKKIKDDLQVEAVKDAKQKAQALASALGITLGGPTSITESYDYGGAANAFKGIFAEAAPGADAGTQLSAGEQEVSVTMNVNYEIK